MAGGKVAILEDDARRVARMRAVLADALPGTEPVFFDRADDMIAWLTRHLGDVSLISLDHDLPVRAGPDGLVTDCGTGRQVAEHLATLRPTCPVIVHSSNDPCATGMALALEDAGWPQSRVYPCDDLAWVERDWAGRIRLLVRDGWIPT